jgi:hypothetical protein
MPTVASVEQVIKILLLKARSYLAIGDEVLAIDLSDIKNEKRHRG